MTSELFFWIVLWLIAFAIFVGICSFFGGVAGAILSSALSIGYTLIGIGDKKND
jgi:hypothetical protein